jgi:chemotaxis protein CheX
MKVLRPKHKKSALIFNEDSDVRDNVQELLSTSVDSITIVNALNLSECLMKLQKQKFTLLVMNSDNIGEDNGRFSDIVFKEKGSSPDNVILLGEHKKVAHDESVSLSFINNPFKPEEFNKLINDIFYPASGKETKQDEIIKKLSAKLLTELAISTDETVEMLSGLKLSKHEIYNKSEEVISGDYSGVISIESKILRLSVAVSFTKPLFLKILNRSLGSDIVEPTEEESLFVGEICNQVCGLLIEKLVEFPTDLVIGLPDVILEPQHTVIHPYDVPVIAIRYNTEFGDVVMEAAIEGKV